MAKIKIELTEFSTDKAAAFREKIIDICDTRADDMDPTELVDGLRQAYEFCQQVLALVDKEVPLEMLKD